MLMRMRARREYMGMGRIFSIAVEEMPHHLGTVKGFVYG